MPRKKLDLSRLAGASSNVAMEFGPIEKDASTCSMSGVFSESCMMIGHYTTTGAEPTENDPVISAGNTIRIDRTMVLNVKAWKPGWNASQTISAGYTILASDPPPFIFVEEGNTNFVAALDSVALTRGPFRILSGDNFSPDHHTRVILFTSNLGLNQSDLGLISVQAAGLPLAVENVGKVTGVPGLNASFVIVRLPDGLPAGELPLTITVRGLLSLNSPTLIISP